MAIEISAKLLARAANVIERSCCLAAVHEFSCDVRACGAYAGCLKTRRDKIQRAATSPKTGQRPPAEQARNFLRPPTPRRSIDRQPKGLNYFKH
jgi:hypothetical protein